MTDPFAEPPHRAEAPPERVLLPVKGLDNTPLGSALTPEVDAAAGAQTDAKRTLKYPDTTSFYKRQGLPPPAPRSASAEPLDLQLVPLPTPPTPATSTPPPVEPSTPDSGKKQVEDEVVVANAASRKVRTSSEVFSPAALKERSGQRHDEAIAHAAEGDRLRACGRWQDAAAEYERAARKAELPSDARDHANSAIAARNAHARRRGAGRIALALFALGAIAAGAWFLRPYWQRFALPPAGAPSTAGQPPSSSAGAAAKPAIASAIALLDRHVEDPHVAWNTIADEAHALLADAGAERARIQAIIARSEGELARMRDEIAAIDRLRTRDPAAALARADRFRADLPRAGTLTARLPLRARLAVSGPSAERVTVSVDGILLPSATPLLFCRSADAPTTLVVEAPGYRRTQVEVAADSDPSDKTVSVTLREAPVWSVPAKEVPAWLRLRVQGSVLAVATPDAVTALALKDGTTLGDLDRSIAAGAAGGNQRWLPMLAAMPNEWWFSSSAGVVIGAALGGDGFAHAHLIHATDHPMAMLVTSELVFRLGARGWFSLSPPPHAEVIAETDEKRLWSHPLSGILEPWLMASGENLVAIDDLAVQVLDQEGKVLQTLKLPHPRSATVAAFSGGRVLAAPTTSEVTLVRATQALHYELAGSLATGAPVAVASDGELLLVADAERTLTLLRRTGDTFVAMWSERAAHALVCAVLSGGFAVCCDDHDVLSLYDLRSHALTRTLALDQPLLAPPVIAGDRIIVADRLGEVRAYALAAPGR